MTRSFLTDVKPSTILASLAAFSESADDFTVPDKRTTPRLSVFTTMFSLLNAKLLRTQA